MSGLRGLRRGVVTAGGVFVAAGAASAAAASSSAPARCDDGSNSPAAAGWRTAALAGSMAAAAWLALRSGSESQAVDTESWNKKWEIGQTNFHLRHIHPALQSFGQRMLDDGISAPHFPKRILFPLCGKTVDMPFLAQAGHRVVGVDCARLALDQLVSEAEGAKITSESTAGQLQVVDVSLASKGPSMKFIVGDFFKLHERIAGTFEAVFDRGSLVCSSAQILARKTACPSCMHARASNNCKPCLASVFMTSIYTHAGGNRAHPANEVLCNHRSRAAAWRPHPPCHRRGIDHRK
jgi:thiopurine S-methyltransferase